MQRPDSFPLTQSRALQLLYDLRYLSIILTAKSEDTKPSRIKQDSGYGAFWGSHPLAVLWGALKLCTNTDLILKTEEGWDSVAMS